MRVSLFKDYLHLAGKLVNIGPAGGRTKDQVRKTNFGILSINLVFKFSNRTCRAKFFWASRNNVSCTPCPPSHRLWTYRMAYKSLTDKLERLQNQGRRGILRVNKTTCTQYFDEEHSRAVHTVQ